MSDVFQVRAIEDIARALKAQAHQEKVRNAIYAINSLDARYDSDIIEEARVFLTEEFAD